jgi:hypothetical protein
VPYRRLYLLAAVAATGSLSACGSGSSASTVAKPTPLRPPGRRHRVGPAKPRIGANQRVKTAGATVVVTIKRLIDPLRDSGASLLPHTHAVGVLVRIRNDGPAVYDSSATGDFSVVPSAGSASPVFARSGECQTQLRDFDNYITAGEVRNGCIAFDVANGARISAIRFSPHAQVARRATWVASR